MTEEQTGQLLTDIAEIKAEVRHVNAQLKIVDKRLSLIEQRLENIEPWVSVENKHLKFVGQNEAVTA
ncbi:MAG TPA: hypothetical protein VFS31_02525 [Chitinophagaceae bacterium]|nr:hypothetical protein [Chitinophagaceae bacterium]